VGEGSQDR